MDRGSVVAGTCKLCHGLWLEACVDVGCTLCSNYVFHMAIGFSRAPAALRRSGRVSCLERHAD